jgi:hypothetical protein
MVNQVREGLTLEESTIAYDYIVGNRCFSSYLDLIAGIALRPDTVQDNPSPKGVVEQIETIGGIV